MAQLKSRHRAGGRPLSAAMTEALAAAQALDAAIAVLTWTLARTSKRQRTR